MTDHMVFLQYSTSICNKGGDAACTSNLPILVLSSSACWWYFLVNFMNSLALDLLLNLSLFWPTQGLILTLAHCKKVLDSTRKGILRCEAVIHSCKGIRGMDLTLFHVCWSLHVGSSTQSILGIIRLYLAIIKKSYSCHGISCMEPKKKPFHSCLLRSFPSPLREILFSKFSFWGSYF